MRSYLDDLNAIEHMRRYYAWKRDIVTPYLGPRILEVGCGTGLMLEQLSGREMLVGIDRDPECLIPARARLAVNTNVRLDCLDVLDERFSQYAGLGLSAVLFANSLEEIADPSLAIERASSVLDSGGKIVIFTPACPALSGKLDHAFEQRRFRPAEVAALIEQGGLEILELKYANLLGILGWIWDSMICKRSAMSPAGYSSRDLLVPVARMLDRLTGPPIGLSLLAAARKR